MNFSANAWSSSTPNEQTRARKHQVITPGLSLVEEAGPGPTVGEEAPPPSPIQEATGATGLPLKLILHHLNISKRLSEKQKSIKREKEILL